MIIKLKSWKYFSKIFLLAAFLSIIFLSYRFAVRPTFKNKDITIVVDAGHGGMDSGACHNNILEKDLNLEIANYLQESLLKEGYKVIMTRTNDILYNNQRRDDLERRVKVAEEAKADLFLSIHVNKYPSAQPFGGEVFYHPKSEGGKELAHCIQEEFSVLQSDSNRSIKEGDFFVLRQTTMPGVIIEVGFLSSPKDRERLQNIKEKKEIAKAITRGVGRYVKEDYDDLTKAGQIASYPRENSQPSLNDDLLSVYLLTNEGLSTLVRQDIPLNYYEIMAMQPAGTIQVKLVDLALRSLINNQTQHISPLPPNTKYRFTIKGDDLLLYLSFANEDYYTGSTIEALAHKALAKTLLFIGQATRLIIINEDSELATSGEHILHF